MTATETRTRWWVAATVALLIVVLAAVGAVVTSSPAVCAKCHVEQARALEASTHRRVACYDCHLPAGRWSIAEAKIDELVSMYPAQLLGRGLRGPGDRISRTACVRCHSDALPGIVVGAKLRIAHDECSPAPDKCDTCHSDSAHDGAVRWPRVSDMDACTGCHVERGASVLCAKCHVGEIPTDVQKAGNLAVTHGSDWERTHGMADLRTCITCHEQAACVRCHGTVIPHPESFLALHGKEALSDKARCSACHPDQSMCTYCHGMAMPHPEGYKQAHMTEAKSRTDANCLRCHREFDCTNCHTRHVHPGATRGTLSGSRLPTIGGGQ